jgi:hypothetical protein
MTTLPTKLITEASVRSDIRYVAARIAAAAGRNEAYEAEEALATTHGHLLYAKHTTDSSFPQMAEELSKFHVDRSIQDFLQTETRLETIADDLKKLESQGDTGIEARIFFNFVVYFRELAPKSLRAARNLAEDFANSCGEEHDHEERTRRKLLYSLLKIRYDILVEAAAYSYIFNAYDSFGRENDILGTEDKLSHRYLHISRISRNAAFSCPGESNGECWYKSPAMDEFDQSFDVVQKVAGIVKLRNEKCRDEGLLLMMSTSYRLAEMYRQPACEHVFAALVEICQVY